MNTDITLPPGRWLAVRRDGTRETLDSTGLLAIDLSLYAYVIAAPPPGVPATALLLRNPKPSTTAQLTAQTITTA